MEKRNNQQEEILYSRFGKDSLIALATIDQSIPFVRTVDAFYEDGAFYILTHSLSNKMQQIAKNPVVAVSGEWFTAHGKAENLGWFGLEENKRIADKMRELFASWLDNGHSNLEDRNTCILRVQLTKGVLFANGNRYEIEF